jgi:hypothetical protein
MQASGNTISSTSCPAACRTKFSILARFAFLSEGECSNWTDAARIFFITSNSIYFYAARVKIVSANDSSLSRFDSAIGRNVRPNDNQRIILILDVLFVKPKVDATILSGTPGRKLQKKWRISCGGFVKILYWQVMKYY